MGKRKPVKTVNAWWCDTCKTDEMTHPQMMVHLKAAHGLDPTGMTCKKQMLGHIDFDDSFQSAYAVTVESPAGTIFMHNETVNPRKNRLV
jgi:hypothetical protein